MPYITQPTNCQVRISPYSQRLIQYGLHDSRVYLSKVANTLLDPYLMGYYNGRNPKASEFPKYSNPYYTDRLDCIVDGLDNDFKIYGRIIECTISPGQCIVDQTILVFPEETKLDINIDEISYVSNVARCILSVNFQWLETLYEQPPRLKLTMIDPEDPLTFGPDIWETRVDRMVISYFDINLDDLSKAINYNPNPTLNFDHPFKYININNVPYEVGPNIIFLTTFAEYLRRHYAKKKIVYTKPCIDPEGLIENQVDIPIIFFNLNGGVTNPIIGISFDIRYNPSEIHKPVFNPDKQLLTLSKLTDVYIDKDSEGNETGLLRIQVGENAYSPVVIPDLQLGVLTFYFNTAAPSGTNVSIAVENTKITYTNATTSILAFESRQDPTNNLNLQSPALTYNYQQAQINYGKINLTTDQRILFYMNGVYQIVDVTPDMISSLTNSKKASINSQLELSIDDSQNLILSALTSSILFTNPSIINILGTDKKLFFEESTNGSGEWDISNINWYWNPTAYDLVSVTYNLTDIRSYILADTDVSFLTSNINVWVSLPSDKDGILQFLLNMVNGKFVLNIRINPTFASSYRITNLSLSMKNGSGLTSNSPSIKDYRRAQHIYQLSGLDLNDGDYVEYKDTTDDVVKKVIFTNDIITVLKNSKYGYKVDNLHMYLNDSNLLVLEPNAYDSDFVFSKIYDFYLNEHEPVNRPCLWFKDSFISTRPVGSLTFVEDLDKTYATCWQQGDLNWQSAGERDFYCTIDISDLDTNFNITQVLQDNFVIHPESIELDFENQQIRLWMPEQFVFQDPMPQLVLHIVG